jgi:CAAX amino terminal protease family.
MIFWNREQQRLRAGWRILLQIVLAVVLSVLTAPFVMLLSGGNHGAGPTDAPLANFVTSITIAASVLLAGRLLDRRKSKDFGLSLSRNWWIDLGFGLFLGALLMTLIFAVEVGAGWLVVTGSFAVPTGSSFVTSVIGLLVMFIGVGVQEELFSRGYHLKNIAEGFSPLGRRTAVAIALLASSAVFGALHLANPNATAIGAINIMFGGVFLASGVLLTGELAIAIGAHITWNFFQGVVFGFPVSGMNVGTTFLVTQDKGDALITGGAFGPEAGLVGIAAMVLGIALTCLWVRVRYGTLKPARDLSQHVGD